MDERKAHTQLGDGNESQYEFLGTVCCSEANATSTRLAHAAAKSCVYPRIKIGSSFGKWVFLSSWVIF